MPSLTMFSCLTAAEGSGAAWAEAACALGIPGSMLPTVDNHSDLLQQKLRGETALVAKIRAGKPATVHSIAFDEGETLLSVQESPVTSHQGCQRLAVLTRSRQEASECPKIIEITTGRCTTILTALSQELSSHLDLMPLVKRLDAEATSLSISLDRHLASFEEAQHSSGRFGPFHHLQVYHWLPGGETLWLEGQGRGQGGSSMQVISANDGEVLHSREIMELKETWED
ncbi:hypothetical protein WJX84_009986 [Apatococcus fuscideae]|uniref:Uncharacterized protein n=1 Tax=Apatococcus fuscideae TaxID=2026836 RepID=A0AAW1T6Z4_9CHLO